MEAEKQSADIISIEKPEAPQVRAIITIKQFSDGGVQVDGPIHDRVTYHGLLYLAGEIGKDWAVKQEAEQRRIAEMRKKEPMWKRLMRERLEKKERMKAEEAAKEAKAREEEAMRRHTEKRVAEATGAESGMGEANTHQQ